MSNNRLLGRKKTLEEQRDTRGPYKTIIFDFDGTLADTLPLVIEMFNTWSNRPEILTPEVIEGLRGMSAQAALKAVGIPLWKLPKLITKGRTLLFKELLRAKPFNDVPSIITELSKNHQLFVMSSNSYENIQSFLTRYKIEKCFDAIYGDVTLFGKTKMLKKIIKDQKLDIKNCVYVGDETRDIEAAHKINLPIVSVTWGYNNKAILQKYAPEFLLDKPSQLLKTLK